MFIKRDIVSIMTTSRFKKFGVGSVLYRPLYIDRNRERISIGNNTTILTGARIELYPEVREKDICCTITIKDDCYLGYNLTILAGANIIIENGVLMASDILISSENHSTDPEAEFYYMDQPLKCAPITIKEGSWIGQRVIILSGVTIGKKSIIGAGSIVTSDIPDYSLAVGSPAKVIKKYNFETHEWERI